MGAAATTTGRGRTGAIVGGAAGSAIGRDLDGGGKQGKPTTVVRTQAVQRVVVEENCGSKKKHKNHPGKGWAKGHNKNC